MLFQDLAFRPHQVVSQNLQFDLKAQGLSAGVRKQRIDEALAHDGTVYDVPGCELGHHGEGVSIDAILGKYGLADPAPALLAQIVSAADSHPSNPHAAGEGLRWIAHGFGALSLSDRDILAQEFIVYDALFAECKRRVAR